MTPRGIAVPHRDKPHVGLLSALPAWAFYVLVIGLFSLAWSGARSLWGLSFVATLAALIIPFGLLVWLRSDPSANHDDSP